MKRPMSCCAWRMPLSSSARVRRRGIASTVRASSQRSEASRKYSRNTVAEAETVNDSICPSAARVMLRPSVASVSREGIGGAAGGRRRGAGARHRQRRRGRKRGAAQPLRRLEQLVDGAGGARPPLRGRRSQQRREQHDHRQHGADHQRGAGELGHAVAPQPAHRRGEHEGERERDHDRQHQRLGVLEQEDDRDGEQAAADPARPRLHRRLRVIAHPRPPRRSYATSIAKTASIARSLERASIAAGGACRGLIRGRSALRADCSPLLGPGSHRRTRFVRCAHCAQTAAMSQTTKRAARAEPGPALLLAPEIAPARHRLPRGTSGEARANGEAARQSPDATAKARAGSSWRASEAPRSAGLVARARSAHRPSDSSPLSERSERSERSEFGDGAASPSIAGQSALRADRLREAPRTARTRLCRSDTTASVNHGLPARAFAALNHALPACAFADLRDVRR